MAREQAHSSIEACALLQLGIEAAGTLEIDLRHCPDPQDIWWARAAVRRRLCRAARMDAAWKEDW